MQNIDLGRRDKVIVLLEDPLWDVMIFGRSGLDVNKTLIKDHLATFKFPTGPRRFRL